MDWGHLFFKFNGRTNRGKFWLAVLIFAVINVVLAILGYMTDQSGVFQAINGMLTIVDFHLQPRRRRQAPARPQQVRLVSPAVLSRARLSW